MKNKKIMVVGQLPPPHHGSNVMADVFCESLKKLGFQVILCEKSFSKKMQEMGDFSLKKILKIPAVSFKIIFNVIVSKPGICFYFASVKPPSLYFDLMVLFFINLLGCGVVLYLHGKGYERIIKEKGPFLQKITHKIFSSCLGAIVLGEALKGDINRHINDDRIFVLPNCIPDSGFLKYQEERPPNKKKSIQILYLSNLVRSKGALEFLKMARQVIRRCQNVRFVLAGAASPDHDFFKEIINYIEKHSLSKFVKIVGAIYGEEKEQMFQVSDIFVFPTFFDLEALPLVNLEAMRAGLPVISSYEGCIPETIINGHNGYIEDPKNIQALSRRVIELVKNDRLREQMGSAARNLYIKKYAPDIYRLNLSRAVNFFFDLRLRLN